MAEFIKAYEMTYYRGMLDELLSLDEGLTDWELDFIEMLSSWDGCFTKPQFEVKDETLYLSLGQYERCCR